MKKHTKARKSRIDLRKEDYHHLLFQGRHWQQGYAKLLREHPYMGKMIPMVTLHRLIHSKIHDIPTPNGKECKAAYERIRQLETTGEIDIDKDSIGKRLTLLIDLWKDTCPATVEILKWQSDIVTKFYRKGG